MQWIGMGIGSTAIFFIWLLTTIPDIEFRIAALLVMLNAVNSLCCMGMGFYEGEEAEKERRK